MFPQLFAIASLQRLGFRLAVILLAVFMLDACGGGGGGGDTPVAATPPPTTSPPATTAPVIATAPLPASVTEGQAVIFVVTATGTSPLTYQWLRNGQVISGATSSGYTTPATTLADNGAQFSVAITNAAGSVTSVPVSLAVTAAVVAPVIVLQPTAQVILVGGQATFSIAVTGSTPLTMQWRKNGTSIAGATNTTYTTPVTLLSDSGALFDVVISNSRGTVTSTAALLTVNPLPLAAAPLGVNADLMGYLVALGTGYYGSSSREAGQQSIPTQGVALVTAAPSGSANAVPTLYNGTLELQGFNQGRYYSPLSVAMQTIVMNTHESGVVQGANLDRYDGAKYIDYGSGNFGLLASNVIIGIRSNFNEVGIGSWKFIGPGQSGYFSGFENVSGSFIVGQPTQDAATAAIVSGTYVGFAHGSIETETNSLYSYNEFSAQASASYNTVTREVTLSLQGFSGYFGGVSFDGIGKTATYTAGWQNPYTFSTTPIFSSPLTCVALVNPSTNTFTCSLTNSSSVITGSFKGKFYGSNGNEMAGTFAITGLLGGGGFNDGIVGAVALKR